MKLIYPMIVHDDSDGLWAEFPDFPGCFTDGETLTELFENAQDAIACDLEDGISSDITIPNPTNPKTVQIDGKDTFLAMVEINLDPTKYSKAVKKTLTIPAWLNQKALDADINFSKVLQDALLQKLKIV